MDPSSITDAITKVTDIAKPVVEKACDFAEYLLGEPLRVAGSALSDHIYAWQTRNRIHVLDKTQKLIQDCEVKPRHVATGFLLQALEAVGNVEDDGLQNLWARLLAGAAEDQAKQITLHIETLRKMSPDDAHVLHYMAKRFRQRWKAYPPEVKKPTDLTYFWKMHPWKEDLPPDKEYEPIWFSVLSRLIALNIIEQNSGRAIQDIATYLQDYFEKKQFRTDLGWDTSHPSMDRELTRFNQNLHDVAYRSQSFLLTRYGLALVQTLGLCEPNEPETDTQNEEEKFT